MSLMPEREQLYNEVWSVPMIHLSKRYGLSGPGLRQVCVKLGIPIPTRGHWARLAAGHNVPRPSLPPDAAVVENEVVERRHRKGAKRSRDTSFDQNPESDRSEMPLPSPERSDAMQPLALHPLIRALLPKYEKEAAEALQRKAKHEWEEAHPGRQYRGVAPPFYSWKHFCDRGQILAATHRKTAIRVSLMTYKRALRLMSSLVAELEKSGFQLTFADQMERLIAKRGEAHISIRLTEKLDAGTRFDRINSYSREKEYEFSDVLDRLEKKQEIRGIGLLQFKQPENGPPSLKVNALSSMTAPCLSEARFVCDQQNFRRASSYGQSTPP